jgi:uncharacterized protein (DUF305 family)
MGFRNFLSATVLSCALALASLTGAAGGPALAAESAPPPQARPDDEMSGLAGYETASENEISLVRLMIEHPERAAALAKTLSEIARDPETVRLAEEIAASQSANREALEQWLRRRGR